MTTKGKNTEILSFSMPKRTARELEEHSREMGYPTRSEFIRDALREFLKEKVKIDGLKGTVEGVVTLLYDHDCASRVSKVRHRYTGIFRSFMHSDFNIDNCSCCEVLIFSGDANEVTKAYYDLKVIKGVEEARIHIVSRH